MPAYGSVTEGRSSGSHEGVEGHGERRRRTEGTSLARERERETQTHGGTAEGTPENERAARRRVRQRTRDSRSTPCQVPHRAHGERRQPTRDGTVSHRSTPCRTVHTATKPCHTVPTVLHPAPSATSSTLSGTKHNAAFSIDLALDLYPKRDPPLIGLKTRYSLVAQLAERWSQSKGTRPWLGEHTRSNHHQ